jgi:hypothetical protein
LTTSVRLVGEVWSVGRVRSVGNARFRWVKAQQLREQEEEAQRRYVALLLKRMISVVPKYFIPTN